MELHEIGNDVYACLQEDRGLGTSNSGRVIAFPAWQNPRVGPSTPFRTSIAPERSTRSKRPTAGW